MVRVKLYLFFQNFNNFHPAIKFEMEASTSEVNYLDLTVYKPFNFEESHTLATKTHVKGTNTFQYIHTCLNTRSQQQKSVLLYTLHQRHPTSLKWMVSRLGDIKQPPMPSYAMATLPVFAFAAGFGERPPPPPPTNTHTATSSSSVQGHTPPQDKQLVYRLGRA